MALLSELNDIKLGITGEVVQIESREENFQIATALAQQSRRTIEIISHLLDPSIFDSTEFINAIRQFVTGNRNPLLRVIVFDPDTIVKNGHRLVDMAGDLTSFIEMRRASKEFYYYNECLMVADGVGFLHRLSAERYEGTANFNDMRMATKYLKEFEVMWNAGIHDPNLRRVNL